MSDRLKNAVRDLYGATARAARAPDAAAKIARAFGYDSSALEALPEDANLGLSCGNPAAIAALKPGETVVDLGSGGGLDVLIAAAAVGPSGRAIGIDMSPDMIALAEANARKAAVTNAEFRLGDIESLPLDDSSIDCILSNCVLNLCTDKNAAFREIARVLKPGGRLAASDIALKRPLPSALKNSLAAYVGCIAGALELGDYGRRLSAAGFVSISIEETGADLNAYKAAEGQAACCSPAAGAACAPSPDADETAMDALLRTMAETDLNAYAVAVNVTALRR
ncbi:MAG: hypothetical protein Tsb0010_04660 [Parvularculaceae bacterium]